MVHHDLAALTEDLMTATDVAGALSVSERTLRRWRHAGEGPPHFTVGRQVFYRRGAVADWFRNLELSHSSAKG